MKRHRLLRYTLWLCLCWLVTLPAKADLKGYSVKTWDYQATIHPNNTWDVVETMIVNFSEPRHGLYHFLPQRFTYYHNIAKAGEPENFKPFNYVMEIQQVEVDERDFELLDTDDEKESLVIKVGDLERWVEGNQKYVFRYRITYPADRFSQDDFIFHSILGADWDVEIEEFSYSLQFDTPLPLEALRGMTIYSGSWGSGGNDLNVRPTCTPEHISGTLTHIPPKQAITFLLHLPEGYFVDARSVNPWWCYLLGIAALLCLGYTLNLLLFSRPRFRPISVVEFYPPKGVSSAEVGTIIDSQADQIDLASLVPWFAHQGYLTIREIPKSKGWFSSKADLELTRVKDLPADAPEYQKLAMRIFFDADEQTCRLSELKDRHEAYAEAQAALQAYFMGERQLVHYDVSEWIWLLLALCCGTLSMGMSSWVTGFDIECLMQGLLLMAFPILLLALLRAYQGQNTIRSKWTDSGLAILAVVATVILTAFQLSLIDFEIIMPPTLLVCLEVLGMLVAYFFDRNVISTHYRTEMAGHLLGFREFIETAEKDRLKMLVDENPAYFYDVLPYAMVFGLSDKWANLFKDLEIEPAPWFHSTTPILTSHYYTQSLCNSLNNDFGQSIQVPSHEGGSGLGGGSFGSGGGFSGGGGGGGGGGSW